jgi:hypothetical protein
MRLTTLGIPILVGLIAAGLNYYVLNQRDEPVKFLRVKERVRAGTTLSAEAVDVVELTAPPEMLKQLGATVVSARDKSLVMGRAAIRDLEPNDLILWRDFVSARGELKKPSVPVPLEGLVLPERLLLVGDQVGFIISRRPPPAMPGDLPGEPILEEIGPFRVSSVSGQTKRPELDSKETLAPGERIITVEMESTNGKLSPNMEKLLSTRVDPNDVRTPKLIAVVLRPQPSPADAGK